MTEELSSSARRARERAKTRERIIETARTLLENEGTAALTMRRVAVDMEYTAPIVYQHFANKEALVLQLIEDGYRLMVSELRQVPSGHEIDTDQRMLRAAAEYVRFAGQHPNLYEAMNGTIVDAGHRRAAAEPAFVFLQELLVEWSSNHHVDLGDGDDACEIVWGTLHGMASLGYLDTVGNERAQRLATEALGAVLRGWRSESSGAAIDV